MNAVKKLITTVTIETEIDPLWVPYLTQNTDIFGYNYCGYWMMGMERTQDRGWLCFEHDDGAIYRSARDVAERHPEYEAILKAWREGKPLPDKWFRLDKAAAIKAWHEGVKRWGVEWYEGVDSIREDVVVQLALLGEIRYG